MVEPKSNAYININIIKIILDLRQILIKIKWDLVQ